MGLLTDLKVPLRVAPEPVYRPAPAAVPEAIKLAPAPPAPKKRDMELIIKRDKEGLVKTVSGYNEAGEEVLFVFTRDGKRNLAKIDVK